MSVLTGILNIEEASADRIYVSTLGQRVVYDAVSQLLNSYNAELAMVKNLFIERTTSDRKFRYKLPGGGRLQRRGGLGMPGARKAGGSWDVGFPLEDFGSAFGGGQIEFAYMTVAELDRHTQTVTVQDQNTYRFELLKAMLNNTQKSFDDDIWGTITVEPLANGDSVVYPPVLGSETEATDDHYLETGYLSAAVSATNDPFKTMVAELEEHFGTPNGGSNIVSFINNAQTNVVTGMANFDEVPDRFVRSGDNERIPAGLPANMPGRILGRVSGSWVVEWRWMPANYILAIDLDAPKPLIERVDIPESGLPVGLNLVATDEEFPLRQSQWQHRFGLGVGNRLNGVVMELGNGGTYTIPTAYA